MEPPPLATSQQKHARHQDPQLSIAALSATERKDGEEEPNMAVFEAEFAAGAAGSGCVRQERERGVSVCERGKFGEDIEGQEVPQVGERISWTLEKPGEVPGERTFEREFRELEFSRAQSRGDHRERESGSEQDSELMSGDAQGSFPGESRPATEEGCAGRRGESTDGGFVAEFQKVWVDEPQEQSGHGHQRGPGQNGQESRGKAFERKYPNLEPGMAVLNSGSQQLPSASYLHDGLVRDGVLDEQFNSLSMEVRREPEIHKFEGSQSEMAGWKSGSHSIPSAIRLPDGEERESGLEGEFKIFHVEVNGEAEGNNLERPDWKIELSDSELTRKPPAVHLCGGKEREIGLEGMCHSLGVNVRGDPESTKFKVEEENCRSQETFKDEGSRHEEMVSLLISDSQSNASDISYSNGEVGDGDLTGKFEPSLMESTKEQNIGTLDQQQQNRHGHVILEAGVESREEEVRQATLEREFSHHLPYVARLNNGSFGSAPKRVLDVQAQWNQQWLQQPDEFCWDPLTEGFLAARQQIAELIQAPSVDEVVLLENATTGASMVALDVMWAFVERKYNKGDSILMFDSAYGAVKKAFQGYCLRAGARLFEYKMPFPVSSDEQILHSFEEALRRETREYPCSKIRLAVIDHITSMPSIILPVCELVKLCRKYGIQQIFVDGAHAIGTVDINVREIDADFYMANVHKWLFAPPVVAFFHSKPQHLGRLHHPVVSHSYQTGLLNETYWVGTRDYSALLAVPAAIKFMRDFFGNLKTYRQFNHDNVMKMGEMLATAWGTCLGAPPELFASMVMVGLPPALNIHSEEDALKMRTRLREEFHVEVPLCYAENTPSVTDAIAGSIEQRSAQAKVVAYARVSHQVYNKPKDYYAFRDAVNMILANNP